MAEKKVLGQKTERVETLETEVKKFAENLPYWAKYLAGKILSGNNISDENIDISYSYLLEEIGLKELTEKPELEIKYNKQNADAYKSDLILTKLQNVEGVNALAENQIVEFGPNLTIIYGTNGSGKSGYVRLLKKKFYSKSPEDILQNVHSDERHKSTNAKFTFRSNNEGISLNFTDENKPEFEQFSVFDGKSVINHLQYKNEFEFRPAGLSFFAEYTDAINRVEQKLNTEITTKQAGNTAVDLSDLFEGESEIKTIVQNLNAKTNLEDLKKYTPFSDADKTKKENIQKEYDDLLLASKGKEKRIKKLQNIKRLLDENKEKIERLNKFSTSEFLSKIKEAIKDCITKEEKAKVEGIESFKTTKINGIGTEAWKGFIAAAKEFAQQQITKNNNYPSKEDNCLLCQQPLSEDAEKLINSYWEFVKSEAEENVKTAQEKLNKIENFLTKLEFDLFPTDNTLTNWLEENRPKDLEFFNKSLSKLKELSENIVSDIQGKKTNDRPELKISLEKHTSLDTGLDATIKSLITDEQIKELQELKRNRTFIEHKERFNNHFEKFETYIKKQIWLEKANKADFAKRKITDTEKSLSNKYFNQKYIDIFNSECKKLNGNFGIEINHTGSAGKTFRQLKLKGKNPNAVLSEGEQKVIAISDFITEMKLSEINRGVIFDDPVTSLDEKRKSEIAERLVNESVNKQVVIFTHDLVFVSSLIGHSKALELDIGCHWIENVDGNQPGTIWLNNTPSFEKNYKTSGKAQSYYDKAKKLPPQEREDKIKNGFAALRTAYETQVVFGLFNGVVQRFEERVSVDSLSGVVFNLEIRDKILDSFYQCCRYMEGHSHSDKYVYRKPTLENLNEEIIKFNEVKKEIKAVGKIQK
ncbi:AAA domain-containing protein [Salegentibacter echinorum]|uniref:AAA domain-containing protein n=1 Tax=Salegentibacter echinorum TaxID=1073325 RepID=A0A1M5ICT3_SALEC|nr:AAA family ATPase [Salegentibacter echinorum]SHG26116.1 AAA domain-containing protein [Salegentibacter echinorum]